MMIGVIGELQNERAVAGGIGELGEEEASVGEGVADMGEGVRVFRTEIPNPHELQAHHESMVSEGDMGDRLLQFLNGNTEQPF